MGLGLRARTLALTLPPKGGVRIGRFPMIAYLQCCEEGYRDANGWLGLGLGLGLGFGFGFGLGLGLG